MASAGKDATGEAVATGSSTKKNRRRISDYLGDSDGGGEASPPSPPETLPQLRLPRFTCATFRFARIGRKRGGRKEVGARKTEDSPAGSKPAETSTSSSATVEASGMGLSMLLLLLARTCVELNRMAEVRAQMETLLKEIRDEAGRMKASAQHHVVLTPARTFNLQLSSSATVSSSSCTSDADTNHHHHPTTEEIARQEGESKPKPAKDDERVELKAAEFEAEPATFKGSTEQETSDEQSSDDEFIELDGVRFGGSGGDLKRDAGGQDSSEEESIGAPDGGVCALELERRLHEVLHRRNRERIEELESALRRAEQKLREKEMEARLWQDTATLALQPPSPDGH